MKNRWMEALIHIIFWSSTALLISTSFSIQSHNIEIVNDEEFVQIVRSEGVMLQILACILIALILFYVNAEIIHRLIGSNKTAALGYSILAFSVAMTSVYGVSKLNLYGEAPSLPNELAIGILSFYYVISIAYSLAKTSLRTIERNRQLLLDKKQSELSLLRNQLQPHFLFNALNNLLAMVNRSEQASLAVSIEKLSQLLRYVVDETRSDKVQLTQEIEFLTNYIDLQLLRFQEEEVDVNVEVIGEHRSQLVEPGLFIVFVENAFKYGTEPEKKTAIDIQFDLSSKDLIRFSIRNKVMTSYANRSGTGIETAKKRLHLIYPHSHDLFISDKDGEFQVQLTLSL